MIKLFIDMTVEEKIQFFLKCQRLLVTFHPKSQYVFTKNNAQEKLAFAKDLISQYKGFCYQDENVAALFNRIVVADPSDPVGAVKANLYKHPHPDFNAVSVDFVVFRKIEDCIALCKSQYTPRMEYIIFVKNNQPKLYKTGPFMAQILHLPSAL